MKNILNSLFLSFIIVLCSTISFAQPKTPIVNKPKHSNNIQIGCAGAVDVEFELTNLELYAPAGVGSTEFLPDGYPDMYLKIQFLGQTEFIEVTEFSYSHTDLVSVWSFGYGVDYNICDKCSDGEFAKVSIHVSLVTPDVNGYIPYPICDFTSEDDIFSCLYFDHLPCNPITGNECTIIGAGSVDTFIKIKCSDPIDPTDPTDPDGNPDNGEGANGESNEDFMNKLDINNTNLQGVFLEVATSPNPFYDQVKISSNKDINRASLYDINGRILLQNTYNNTDDYNVQLNTSEIPSGIFFIKVESDGEIEMIKMIK